MTSPYDGSTAGFSSQARPKMALFVCSKLRVAILGAAILILEPRRHIDTIIVLYSGPQMAAPLNIVTRRIVVTLSCHILLRPYLNQTLFSAHVREK